MEEELRSWQVKKQRETKARQGYNLQGSLIGLVSFPGSRFQRLQCLQTAPPSEDKTFKYISLWGDIEDLSSIGEL